MSQLLRLEHLCEISTNHSVTGAFSTCLPGVVYGRFHRATTGCVCESIKRLLVWNPVSINELRQMVIIISQERVNLWLSVLQIKTRNAISHSCGSNTCNFEQNAYANKHLYHCATGLSITHRT